MYRTRLTEELKDELYLKSTGHKTAIEVSPATELSSANVIEIVVLDHDGATVAYRYSTDSQDQPWKTGTIENAVDEALDWLG